MPEMAGTKTKSWLPKGGGTHRSSSDGRFITVKSSESSPATTMRELSKKEAGLKASSSFKLRNGDSITSVRKDVLDRALSRGEFKKK
jgi:hypothetical protein